ncbi:unnamed protein product [Fraxinus pennsylvanica]|uniref:non-specific serine/threonine protein kinase n=1 Tax=Fraxinus pennsylvanica TaxID=56036 RepID=A0AAD2A9G1_9LAMI|nr:unnamed protein product [Fraxinus pennsylvanica]
MPRIIADASPSPETISCCSLLSEPTIAAVLDLIRASSTFLCNFNGDGVNGCLMWYGDLIDIREVPGADSTLHFYIRLPRSELVVVSDNDSDKKKKKKTPGKLIFISTAVGVLISGIILGAILLKIRLMRQGKRKTEDLDLPSFDLATIAAATDNFSSENIIGEGGFGQVFRGSSPDGQEIAVKRLSKTSRQGLEEFKNEVSLIAKLQHRNLVRLLGCCTEGDERMLIYEYMQNKSLDNFIFDQERRTILTWPKRILGGGQGIARTKRVIGTYGYMAPEYTIDGKFSIKSDVFSMGVVLLEIVSAKRNRGFRHLDHYHSLLGHAWLLWNEDKALELMDECLIDSFVECQVKRCIHVGLLCVQKHAEDRPLMSSVLFMLGSEEGAILPEPKEPGFFIERSSFNEKTCTSEANTYTISITDLEGR